MCDEGLVVRAFHIYRNATGEVSVSLDKALTVFVCDFWHFSGRKLYFGGGIGAVQRQGASLRIPLLVCSRCQLADFISHLPDAWIHLDFSTIAEKKSKKEDFEERERYVKPATPLSERPCVCE